MERWTRNLPKICGILLLCLCLAGTAAASPQNTGQTGVLNGANGNGHHWVRLSWSANAGGDNVTGYNIYRSTTSGSGYVLQTVTPVPNLYYRDDAVTHGTEYYYVITAVNTYGEGPESSQVSVTP